MTQSIKLLQIDCNSSMNENIWNNNEYKNQIKSWINNQREKVIIPEGAK